MSNTIIINCTHMETPEGLRNARETSSVVLSGLISNTHTHTHTHTPLRLLLGPAQFEVAFLQAFK